MLYEARAFFTIETVPYAACYILIFLVFNPFPICLHLLFLTFFNTELVVGIPMRKAKVT